jgi:hypothetical protein
MQAKMVNSGRAKMAGCWTPSLKEGKMGEGMLKM